jgi:hypothetical protein
MLADGLFDLGIARQGSSHAEAEPLRGLLLCQAVVTDPLVDDDACRFLGNHEPRALEAI